MSTQLPPHPHAAPPSSADASSTRRTAPQDGLASWSEAERKQAVRAVVRDLLADEAPEDLPDLATVFDVVYATADERLDGLEEAAMAGDGLPLDASFLAGTALGSLVWTVVLLLRARWSVPASGDRQERLQARVRQLVHQVGEERVRQAEERVRRLEEAVARLQGHRDGGLSAAAGPPAEPGVAATTDGLVGPRTEPAAGTGAISARGADLTLEVRRESAGPNLGVLGYWLRGVDGAGHRVRPLPVWGVVHADPAVVSDRALRTAGGEPDAARLLRIGSKLGERLLPAGLAGELRRLAGPAADLLVVSEVPGVLWEILIPPGAGGPAEEASGARSTGEADGPACLAEAFALAHWPVRGWPVQELRARRIAVVPLGDSRLRSLPREVAFLRRLAGEGGAGKAPTTDGAPSVEEVVEIRPEKEAVLEALAGGRFDVVHFCGHGSVLDPYPDTWSFQLGDDSGLDGLDLGARTLAGSAPLVVLNACWLGSEGRSLAGIGGLAVGFAEAGAAAVVAPRWRVSDDGARAFTEAFYPRLLAGFPLGEAVRGARESLAAARPTDGSRFAYTVLGHPGARCTVAGSP